MTEQPRRRTALATLTIITMMTAQVLAGPRSVQVLPIDGNADAATRKKITASVQKLARVIDGKIELGTTTFADTAAAVGCDPATPSCAESVRTTLDVDELVYGTATLQNGQVTVVVRRKAAGSAPREQLASMSAQDAPDRIEPTLLPLFTGGTPAPSCPDGTTPNADGKCGERVERFCPDGTPQSADGKCPPAPTTCPDGTPADAEGKCAEATAACPNGELRAADGTCSAVAGVTRTPMTRDKKFGLVGAVGGGAMLVIGLALWSSKASLQDDIDAHPTNTVEDFEDLQALEDKAGSRAIFGNLMVFGGLALAGAGAWLLWRDHKAKRGVMVTPAPVEGGATVTLTIFGGLR